MKTSCKVFVLFISLNEEAVVLAPSNQKEINFDTFSNIFFVLKPLLLHGTLQTCSTASP